MSAVNALMSAGAGQPGFAGTWKYTDGWTFNKTLWSLSYFSTPVCYNGTIFVVGGTWGKLGYSYDGENWVINTNVSTKPVNGFNLNWCLDFDTILWDGSRFVACLTPNDAGQGTWGIFGNCAVFASSTDGINWTYLSNYNFGSPTYEQYGVSDMISQRFIWTGTQYVIVGISGKIATSSDAVTWTTRTQITTTTWGTSTIFCIVWNGSQYVIGGLSGKIATSTDAITWTYRAGLASTGFSTTDVTFMAYLNSKWIVTNTDGGLAYSNDAITWTYTANLLNVVGALSGLTFRMYIVYNGASYIATGGSSSPDPTRSATSPDLVTWTYYNGFNSPVGSSDDIYGINYTGGYYYCYDLYGYFFYSTNGFAWYRVDTMYDSYAQTTFRYPASGLAVGPNQLVVVGWIYTCATSSDGGRTWTYQPGLETALSPVSIPRIDAIVYGNSQYVVGSEDGKIATSADAITWTYRSGLSSTAWGSNWVRAIGWNGSNYIAVGSDINNLPLIATSTDAITWTFQSGPKDQGWYNQLYFVTWNGSYWLTGGFKSTGVGETWVFTSSDGNTWTKRVVDSTLSNECKNIIWDGTKWALISGAGYLYTSTDSITWTKNTSLRDFAIANGGNYTLFAIAWDGRQYLVGSAFADTYISKDLNSWRFSLKGNQLDVDVEYGFKPIYWTGSRYVYLAGKNFPLVSP